MRIDHVAIWTDQLEQLKDFYVKYFHAQAGSHYHNPNKGFESYFLSFTSGARLELMRLTSQPGPGDHPVLAKIGYAHISLAASSMQAVDDLTHLLQQDGFTVVDGPRLTGDGYYESVVLDPDGNQVELTV